jgi:hypothetical protein
MVMCQQWYGAEQQAPVRVIASNTAHLSDLALLARKAQSAEENGWAVTWVTPTRVRAVKRRGIVSPVTCVRVFWIEA